MDDEQTTVSGHEVKKNKLSKLPNIVEPGYVAPDGGWGWMIIIAAGFSNFFSLSLILAYGLMFRSHFERLGINIAQTTTISNINSAVLSCVGLSNGPLYRKFSYRQISCFGSFLCALSVCVLSFMNTFYGILISYAIFHAIGGSLALSSCLLALNTYFKKRKRLAFSLAWTCTGLAPIIVPQLVALWLPIYDVNGTVLLFGGIMFNGLACSLLLQPISKHMKKESLSKENKIHARMDGIKEKSQEVNCTLLNGSRKTVSMDNALNNDKPIRVVEKRLNKGFVSHYLPSDDKVQGAIEVEVIMAETPVFSCANDGWFSKLNSSNMSLAANKMINRQDLQQAKSGSTSSILSKESSLMTSIRLITENDGSERRNTPVAYSNHNNTNNDETQKIDDNELSSKGDDTTEDLLGVKTLTHPGTNGENKKTKKYWYKRAWHVFAVFFELDLLRDPVYLNLMVGITLFNFSDVNMFQMTPFILGDYGLEQADVANIMSILATVDVMTRLVVPIIASSIGWQNRIFYIVSMVALMTSRILLAHFRSYNFLMAIAVLTGIGRAFRQVFVSLLIPEYIPLERLPAAIGLQLASGGITYLIFGPVIGWIRDVSGNYTLVLHFLNLFPYLVMISWIFELSYFSMKRKPLDRIESQIILP